LPGGFVGIDEPLEEAAARELMEETGLGDVSLEQLGAFGAPGRDPRGRTISVAFWTVLPAGRRFEPVGGDDAAAAGWFDVAGLPEMAFDHGQIVGCALQRLRREVAWGDAAFRMLGGVFTMRQLRQVLETVLGRRFDTQALRRRLVSTGLIRPREDGRTEDGGRLYEFVPQRFEEYRNRRLLFYWRSER